MFYTAKWILHEGMAFSQGLKRRPVKPPLCFVQNMANGTLAVIRQSMRWSCIAHAGRTGNPARMSRTTWCLPSMVWIDSFPADATSWWVRNLWLVVDSNWVVFVSVDSIPAYLSLAAFFSVRVQYSFPRFSKVSEGFDLDQWTINHKKIIICRIFNDSFFDN